MVSRRKFFSIIIMMGVLLFMFQFTQVIKENSSEYGKNIYADIELLSGAGRWRPASDSQDFFSGEGEQNGNYVALIGNADNDVGNIVSQWCVYTKRQLVVFGQVEEYMENPENKPEFILLDSAVIDYRKDTDHLTKLAEQGMNLVFCNLPDVSVIRGQAKLRKLLGIREIRAEEIETDGIHLFEDFFLGRSYIYQAVKEEDKKRQDLQLNMPWYVTLSGTKTYMVGMLDELLKNDEAKNEYFPGIIWRNSYEDAKIFVVNGDFMSDSTGIGILSAMVYEMNPYDIYPVVNAQNLLLADFPHFAEENAREMQRVYNRQPGTVQQDIIWPTVLSTVKRSGWKLTCFFSPQFIYGDDAEPSVEDVPFYLEQLREAEAEAGLSLRHGDTVSFGEKLRQDGEFYKAMDVPYKFYAALMSAKELSEIDAVGEADYGASVRTVACMYEPGSPILSYTNDFITRQSIIGRGESHTYSEDIRLRSLETALGYSSVVIDMHKVFWPESEEAHWEKLYERMSSNLNTWWRPFRAFEKTVMTESDERVRTFLNLDYTHSRERDRIRLEVSGIQGNDSWFILRTHGESIAEMKGGVYEKIEKDAYLLHVLDDQADIRLEQSRGVLRYIYDR